MPSEVFAFSCNDQIAARLNEMRKEGKSISAFISDAIILRFKLADAIRESKHSFVFQIGEVAVTVHFELGGEQVFDRAAKRAKKK